MPEPIIWTTNGQPLDNQEAYARAFNSAKVPQSILDMNYEEWA